MLLRTPRRFLVAKVGQNCKNMDTTFPIIKVPERIIEILEGKNISPSKPNEPTPINKPIEPSAFKPITLIYPAAGLVLINVGFPLAGVILFGIFIFGVIIHISESNKYQNQLIKYNQEYQKYLQLKNEYNKKLLAYNEFIKKLNEEAFISTLKKSLISKFFSDTTTFEIETSPRKGKSESSFLKTLQEYFADEIYINKAIEIFSSQNYGSYYDDYESEYDVYYDSEFHNPYNLSKKRKHYKPYCPDFIFKHNLSNLHIDIEIDEPYTEGKAIHYYGNPSDYKRNNYFLNHGWFVIRFAEEQIINFSASCCYAIAVIIYKYTNDDSYIKKFHYALPLKDIKIWTKEESLELMKMNYRENY